MNSLLYYLLMSGLCLLVLYSAYFLVLKKQTFFNFNRLYLISIVVFSILLPTVSFKVSEAESVKLNSAIVKISELKGTLVFDGQKTLGTGKQSINTGLIAENLIKGETQNLQPFFEWNLIAQILVLVYLLGVLFFGIRLVLLYFSLWNLIATNKIIKYKEYKLVKLTEKIAPFSFFKYVFINKEGLTEHEFLQILFHESVHIKQKHSIDLLFIHLVAVFHWFNPIMWKIIKAAKTNHEFIVDKKIIEKEKCVYDYQHLLLSQLISIRPSSLVNSFSLLPIKRRMEMMRRSKPGFKKKAALILLLPLFTFSLLMFSNFSVDFIQVESELQILKAQLGIELPGAPVKSRRIMYNKLSFPVYISTSDVYVGNSKVEGNNMKYLLQNQMMKLLPEQQKKITVCLLIDQDAKMGIVAEVKQKLRELNLLKVAYVLDSVDKEKGEGIKWSYAILRKLPPLKFEQGMLIVE